MMVKYHKLDKKYPDFKAGWYAYTSDGIMLIDEPYKTKAEALKRAKLERKYEREEDKLIKKIYS
jgi:hypothetical protein